VYSRITSTKSPSFCMTAFRVRLTHITAILPQAHDFLYYVSRRKLTSPPQQRFAATLVTLFYSFIFYHFNIKYNTVNHTGSRLEWITKFCNLFSKFLYRPDDPVRVETV
jgi:hypothetical protein